MSKKEETMEKRTNLKTSSRLLILLCLMLVGLIVSTILLVTFDEMGLLGMLTVQDIMTFIVPAIAAMAIFYRRPLHTMALNRAPSWLSIVVVIAFFIISLPAMNWLVAANESLTLPSWMGSVEQWMRTSEDAAAATTAELLDINTIPRLLYCVFVVGLMAGLSEEMLFRGAMLRTMQDSRLGTHAAIWIVAIIFSAIHLQFYGFIPRMLLGVWLGYLLMWTRSLWVPIIAHTLNNSTVVIFSYLTNIGLLPEGYGDHIGLPSPGGFPWLALVSLACSIALALWAHRHFTTFGKSKSFTLEG